MGVSKTVVVSCTCDVCGKPCEETDNYLHIEINGGDGRDVGSSYIHAKIQVTKPYAVSGGIVCKTCQVEWLSRYVKYLEKTL